MVRLLCNNTLPAVQAIFYFESLQAFHTIPRHDSSQYNLWQSFCDDESGRASAPSAGSSRVAKDIITSSLHWEISDCFPIRRQSCGFHNWSKMRMPTPIITYCIRSVYRLGLTLRREIWRLGSMPSVYNHSSITIC